MVLLVAGLGDGEQGGDRPALDDVEVVAHQAPFDVLGPAEVRLDVPAQPYQPQDLGVGQRRLRLPPGLDRRVLDAAFARRQDRTGLGGDRRADDLVVAHRVDVPGDQPGDERLAEPPPGLHGGDLPVRGHRVRGEQDPGRVGEHHPLHDHRHAYLAVVEAVAAPVGHRAFGEQRGPAPPDVQQDRVQARDVEVGVLLAGEGRGRQVLGRGAGPYRAGGPLPQPGERRADLRHEVAGQRDALDDPADLGAQGADRLAVIRFGPRELVELGVERRRRGHDPLERVRRDAEAVRHADALDRGKLPELRPLAADLRDLRRVDLIEMHDVSQFPSLHRSSGRLATGSMEHFSISHEAGASAIT